MRFPYLFLLLLLLGSISAAAQAKNDLWVVAKEDGWSIQHKVQKGETLFSVSRRYHVPPAILAEANGLTYQDGLKEGSTVNVPLGAYNMQTSRPQSTVDTRALYYKVRPEDNLYRISRRASVSQRTLQEWNQLSGNTVSGGQTLLVGWILYDATPFNAVPGVAPPITTGTSGIKVTTGMPKPVVVTPPPPVVNKPKVTYDTPKYVMQGAPDTLVHEGRPAPAPNSLEAAYDLQTQDGQNATTEHGAAAFYAITSKTKGAAAYAFHNTAPRGTVIKVRNVNNGRYVFVKVIGPLPMTKQYVNSIIGLSNAAKAALGVKEARAFCELSY